MLWGIEIRVCEKKMLPLPSQLLQENFDLMVQTTIKLGKPNKALINKNKKITALSPSTPAKRIALHDIILPWIQRCAKVIDIDYDSRNRGQNWRRADKIISLEFVRKLQWNISHVSQKILRKPSKWYPTSSKTPPRSPAFSTSEKATQTPLISRPSLPAVAFTVGFKDFSKCFKRCLLFTTSPSKLKVRTCRKLSTVAKVVAIKALQTLHPQPEKVFQLLCDKWKSDKGARQQISSGNSELTRIICAFKNAKTDNTKKKLLSLVSPNHSLMSLRNLTGCSISRYLYSESRFWAKYGKFADKLCQSLMFDIFSCVVFVFFAEKNDKGWNFPMGIQQTWKRQS